MIDVELDSWVHDAARSDFPIQNLPYGVFLRSTEPRIGVAIGEYIFDLCAAAHAGLFDGAVAPDVLQAPALNPLLGAGRATWTAVRQRTMELLRAGTGLLEGVNRDSLLVAQRGSRMAIPVQVSDYVDFYSSLEHATNLGKIFRPDAEPLLPNWRWIPIGYHGRSSTIVVDGTPVVRPCGQRKPADAPTPVYGPTAMLDIELEVGFVTGSGNAMGSRIPVERANECIFGLLLVNDWSARDIQAWEYQPLGPFLGKSFATSVSPWIVTLDALEPYRVQGPAQNPAPLPYLQCSQPWNFDIELQVELETIAMHEKAMPPQIIARSNFKYMYWNMAQQLAHATVNGAVVRPGDLYASGTISGPTPDSYGSFIELTWRGTKPLTLASGEKRSFLQDGDTVTLRGYCEQPGKPRIGFGSVSGTILPAMILE
jgi:fumarylacetoacetase